MWHKGSPFAGFVNPISPVNTLSKRLRKPGMKTAQAQPDFRLTEINLSLNSGSQKYWSAFVAG